VVLPFNDDSYSTAQPALNNEETKLYFSSNMEGTLGGSDIWYVDILENGSLWQTSEHRAGNKYTRA